MHYIYFRIDIVHFLMEISNKISYFRNVDQKRLLKIVHYSQKRKQIIKKYNRY